MLGLGLTPLGALAGGFVAHDLGVRAAFPIAGVLRGGVLILARPALLSTLRASDRGGGRSSTASVTIAAKVVDRPDHRHR